MSVAFEAGRVSRELTGARVEPGERASRNFARFAVLVLLFNLPVILWGAYVRVSFSGDGCGANWPFCNGQVLPQKLSVPTVIEFTHRLMTMADSVLVIVLCAAAFILYPKRHAVRRYAVWSLSFLLIEAALGAGLVLFRFVARSQSAGRVWYLSAHLTNTLLLLGALTATAWCALRKVPNLRMRQLQPRFVVALAATVGVSITGAIVALGDMLFPVQSLSAGLKQDFSSASGMLLRLRFIHPVLAIAAACYLVSITYPVIRKGHTTNLRRASLGVFLVTLFQLITGIINLGLLAPLPLQLFHLLVADLLWIAVLLMSLESTQASPTHVE